jgi:hypothetical protein
MCYCQQRSGKLTLDTSRHVPAELAMRCLKSALVDTEDNIRLIGDLKLYVAWQSNLAYLKKPPPGYMEAAVDIVGEMDSMLKQLELGGYNNEYDFQFHLSTLFGRAYDNHLTWVPDILHGVFQFGRPDGMKLRTASADGVTLPEVYTYRDLLLTAKETSFKPSPVRTINSKGAEEYLQEVASQVDYHDADARWNALFPDQPKIAFGEDYFGLFRYGRYPGPNTIISFENSATMTVRNVASISVHMIGIDNGDTLFERFCTGPRRN